MNINSTKLSIREKVGYALGDGAANIGWRGVSTFLIFFYTDVFGINAAAVGMLMLIARTGDGVSDVLMGIIGDRTNSKYGKFRPWVLWSAIPLGVILSLLFTTPDFSPTGKIIYAYVTYIVFTLVYTANNIPYGALMAVMTGDDKERTSIGSFRMVGAFTGGMIVQGALLYLVVYFGNVNPTIDLNKVGNEIYKVTVSSPVKVASANINTDHGIALFKWPDNQNNDSTATASKSFMMEAGKKYTLLLSGEKDISASDISLIDQKQGYSRSIYLMSVFLSLFMLLTFFSTKERVKPPKSQESNLKEDLIQLIKNKPWFVLLIIGLLFNIYNNIKQGMVVIYFSHFLHHQLLASSFMVSLTLASILGAMATSPLSRRLGKKKLFIMALIFSGAVNALLVFCGPHNIAAIFSLGIISEFGAAIFPTLFFTMLGDAADYSEFKNGRRATGLIYSAGSFATKFGGGVASAIMGFVLGLYHYKGQDASTFQGAIPGIIMLMSYVPAIIAFLAAGIMYFYPLDQQKMDKITIELNNRRLSETGSLSAS